MKLHFTASPSPNAQQAFFDLTKQYGQAAIESCDTIVSLGGDGQTLSALHKAIKLKKPVFGLNFGHVGFMQNLHNPEHDLIERIATAQAIDLNPLRIEAVFADGDIRTDFAINDAYVCNHKHPSAIHLRISIDGIERISQLEGDGVIVCTSIGSSAYNRSAKGPILPLGNDLMSVTPNNPCAPYGIMPSIIRPAKVEIEVLSSNFRQADLCADSRVIGENNQRTRIWLDGENPYRLLFDRGYGPHERVMRTQFARPWVTG